MVSPGRERRGMSSVLAVLARASVRPVRGWVVIGLGLLGLAGGAGGEPLPTWKADHMMIAIQILPQDRIRVDEQIALDLGFERHRQLERRIRLAPLTPGGPRLDIRLIAVTDAQGAAWPIRTWQWGDDLELRIGNGESFLTGRQSIHLVYEVDGAVLPGRKRDELVWDVGGGPWEVPIVDTRITVGLPPGAEPEIIDAGSAVGRPGELVRHADFKTVDRAQVRFSLMTGLAPRETCRIFVSWPAGLTPALSPLHRGLRALALRPWWGTTGAALVMVALALLARSLARARARRPHAKAPALAPAELAWLRTPELGAESLLATTLDLARRAELAILPSPAGNGIQLRLPPGDEPESPAAGPDPDADLSDVPPPERWRPFEAQWRSRIFAESPGTEPAPIDRECSAAELAWRASLARPAVASALALGLVESGYLHDRRPSRILKRAAWRLAIAIAVSAFLALLVGARFPAAWPGIVTAAVTACLLPLWIECRRRTVKGEAAVAWARVFAARVQSGAARRRHARTRTRPICRSRLRSRWGRRRYSPTESARATGRRSSPAPRPRARTSGASGKRSAFRFGAGRRPSTSEGEATAPDLLRLGVAHHHQVDAGAHA